jgi:uncharacterized membrane protein YphA (DoxX/SURF4 family)
MFFNIEADGAMSIAMLFLAHLRLCAAYIQGGLVKLMIHFRLAPSALFAVLVIALELLCSTMVMTDFMRWLGALVLARVHSVSTLIALPFWKQRKGEARHATANAFFEHVGLAGGFLLVAWLDRARAPTPDL